MAAGATVVFHLSAPRPSLPINFPSLHGQPLHSKIPVACRVGADNLISSPLPSARIEKLEAGEDEEVGLLQLDDGNPSSLPGCRACGRERIEPGCNGEGRIQGGIGTIPGFGWWPIKAYRPCPAYVASGARYRRTGQSMDEVISGRYSPDKSNASVSASSKKTGKAQ